MTQRLVKHPYLAIFDGPDTNVSTEARTRSTVPLQALYLMNNPFVQEQAAGLARRLIAELDAIRRAASSWLTNWPGRGRRHPMNADRAHRVPAKVLTLPSTSARIPDESRETEAWTSLAKVMLTANEFLYID